VSRQLRYSLDETLNALDAGLFINGLPIATFELKNSLTKQTVEDAVEQYKRDRNPRELLFQFGRCMAHFAVDDSEVMFCPHLKGKASWFLPFNKGWNDGAGNPPNPDGLKTDYLWKRVLAKDSLTNIIEKYAQIVETEDKKTGKKKREQIFPRYHQLEVVRRLLDHVGSHGAGTRYLIEHSAGSGKSNSIAWLAHQLVGLKRNDAPIFESVIVVTDRTILDSQLHSTIKNFLQVGATVGHAEHSGDLRRFIEGGKKIIISTVQKFPYILEEIGSEHRGRSFAVIIDEAHSSRGGKTAAALSTALSEAGQEEDDETIEDKINRIMEAKKLLPNASYFAFTATPKNKTMEIFGEPFKDGDRTKYRPFHSYTMKQAIDEGFILESIDMDSYRLEKKAAVKIQLPDQDVEIEPVPTDGGGGRAEPELDRLSNILKSFNDLFGNVTWTDSDRVRKLVTEEIPAKVAADKAYQNARKNSDKQNAKVEHDKALKRVMTAVLKDDSELYKQFSDNPEFKRWLTDTVFSITYDNATK
jgi:type I restriction enzyme R subunit